MDRRPELGQIFRDILGSDHVYFQSPETVKMKYPAIKYERSDIENMHADNNVYQRRVRYTVTVIDSDPDSVIVSRVGMLPLCRFERHYAQENLNHDVFEIYY